MKYDFTYFNPTRIHFGKNALSNLASEVSEYGENVLLVYGKFYPQIVENKALGVLK